MTKIISHFPKTFSYLFYIHFDLGYMFLLYTVFSTILDMCISTCYSEPFI